MSLNLASILAEVAAKKTIVEGVATATEQISSEIETALNAAGVQNAEVTAILEDVKAGAHAIAYAVSLSTAAEGLVEQPVTAAAAG